MKTVAEQRKLAPSLGDCEPLALRAAVSLEMAPFLFSDTSSIPNNAEPVLSSSDSVLDFFAQSPLPRRKSANIESFPNNSIERALATARITEDIKIVERARCFSEDYLEERGNFPIVSNLKLAIKNKIKKIYKVETETIEEDPIENGYNEERRGKVDILSKERNGCGRQSRYFSITKEARPGMVRLRKSEEVEIMGKL